MNKPRNIPFGQMTTLEAFQVLIKGKMPDGTIIEQDIKLQSLKTILQIVKYEYLKDVEICKMLNDPKDIFTIQTEEIGELIERAEDLLKERKI